MSCPEDSRVIFSPAAHYVPFRKYPPRELEQVQIFIHPRMEDIWDIAGFDEIFDSGQSWSIFRRDSDYILAINPQEYKTRPLCVAEFARSLKEVNIYCSDVLTRSSNGTSEITNPFTHPLDRLLMMYILAGREGALMHAAAVDMGGKGFVFPGRSGAGKSTLSRAFISADGPMVLSDERTALRRVDGIIRTFGTPWPGEAGIADNGGIPLSGIFFITHKEANKIEELSPREALRRLLPVVSIPWYDTMVMPQILHFCESLISNVPAFELGFLPGGEVVDLLVEFAEHV
jgi:hypothetical protein